MNAPFPKGRFWQLVMRRAARARVNGALQPIDTERVMTRDRGIPFMLRSARNLAAKALASGDGSGAGEGANPFLPYDPDLFVCDVSASHLCLLNKFSVVDHHLLIVTRHFEPQENMLTFADLEAVWICLSEVDGIAFFNSGRASGASQPHRHLQLVPLPMSDAPDPYPFAPLFAAGSGSDIAHIPELPFRHAVMWIHHEVGDTPQTLAERTQAEYGLLLDAVGLAPIDLDRAVRASGSYNLLLTRHWMMIVPRSEERYGTVSVNALAFVGSLFVKRHEELEQILKSGPLAVLTEVALPP